LATTEIGRGRKMEVLMRDILGRLRTDAGQLTIAALIQEREVAAAEIARGPVRTARCLSINDIPMDSQRYISASTKSRCTRGPLAK
jgi:hypothetical protein